MDNRSLRLESAGGIRAMAARWVVTGEMRLETAAHFGGEGDAALDMAVLRDPKEGLPLLPGTSLAGALRSHLADILGGYRSREKEEVAALFGAARSDDAGSQSPLIVFDSLGTLPGGRAMEIRDGVAIDPALGTAEAHKKFDFEVLPAGTTFPVRVELIVERTDLEPRLLGLLSAALDGLTNGDIALGMRRSRGLGSVKVNNWKALRHDLATAQGWLSWLTSDHEMPIVDGVPAHASAAEAIQAACPSLKIEQCQDKRRRLLADLDLEVEGDLLVRSPATEPGAPDVVHLHSAGRPVLPGTGMAGALRAQALRIARLVREGKGDGDRWVDRLFGPRLEEDEKASNGQAKASRLRISESFIENGTARRQTRIAIDRFTGGVVRGALFDEQVQAGGTLKVRLEIRNPEDAEVGLVLLLLKDLLSGEIPVGGAASVGRGVLKGAARLRLPDGKTYRIAKDLHVEEETRKVFDEKITGFHNAEPLKAEEVRP
ncbi:CRISPR/Cas system CSM-associated protein Csm3, group 7 of RAMP superfamily [Desulfacinum infernum DSM 9756]|uniref:CRISPR/Cas system CSM-associated protein Csm3, group 7 of RAMP superfamily n=1 Tax=Desulfacinum infernum DSM 9756 TaxID=1121391 RepID=A0A1M5ATU7_9BACT|nr:RAMP superfamily CRISPR-associated protein [Desulfacinum infernum]SHF33624.1 CRISPR/Cas system CSM-associated protein Csm3, group 7 of RAMP superfamily [Desulfacinum infernum DSM 9756]